LDDDCRGNSGALTEEGLSLKSQLAEAAEKLEHWQGLFGTIRAFERGEPAEDEDRPDLTEVFAAAEQCWGTFERALG